MPFGNAGPEALAAPVADADAVAVADVAAVADAAAGAVADAGADVEVDAEADGGAAGGELHAVDTPVASAAARMTKARSVIFSRSGAEGDRTPDLIHAMDALSQLSYGPLRCTR